ncbi:unnamed protein product [Peronospora belbahrii]|uniref:Reverse transcriptase Ty1/copia-type domain-containing protein n=1 Tax=Peronospora belbahrii TaxID=622444 RepID=A0AAU9LT90_9STRA|nr:unnamed protein product [Peronospora belbahrii]
MERHKARLVVSEKEQVVGMDYALKFAAVMDMTTVKMILAVSANWGVPAKHDAVSNAYVKAEKEHYLKILIALEFFFASLKFLSSKSLGPVLKFRGMCVTHSNDREYLLDQEGAILDVIHQHGMLEENAARAPIGVDLIRHSERGERATTGHERARTAERPHASVTCGFVALGGQMHKTQHLFCGTWGHVAETRSAHARRNFAKHGVRYLSGTRALTIRMTATAQADAQPTLVRSSDADKSDQKSLSGCVVLLNDMALGGWSKNQGGVALRTTESEFVAASEAGRELHGIREALTEIGVTLTLPLTMHIDNQAAIVQIAGEATSTKAKHIDVRVKYLCEQARRGIVVPVYVKSELMLADVITKALDASKLVELRTLLQIT